MWQGVSQEINVDAPKMRLGFEINTAKQPFLFLNSQSYTYANWGVSGQIFLPLSKKRKTRFELRLAPTVYFSTFKLENPFYITPSTPNFEALRAYYSEARNFTEWVLNIGLVYKLPVSKNIAAYVLGNVGPMYSSFQTIRLHKGLAFSDILGLGVFIKQARTRYQLGVFLRHNSNASLKKPNAGHNSFGLSLGASFVSSKTKKQ